MQTIVPLSYVATQNVVSPVTGSPYAIQLSAEGGLPPYRWLLIGGALPAGLSLSPSGVISGTPTSTGTFAYAVAVNDSKGATAGGSISGTMNASGVVPFDISQPLLLPAYGQNEDVGYEPFVEGGTPPYTFTVTGLPAGVTYDAATGTLAGEPTSAGSYAVTLTLTDSTGKVAGGTPTTVAFNVNAPQALNGASGGGGAGGNGGTTGTTGPTGCVAPVAQLVVNVTAEECTACTRIAVIAESPQITAAIAAGRSPCSNRLATGPVGCNMDVVYADFASCGGTSCGPYTLSLGDEFGPAVTGVAAAITDTVSFCPFDTDGTTFTPAGTCVSSLPGQCDPSATLTVIVNGVVSSPMDAGTAGG